MFERFTEAARHALFWARYEVSELGAPEIRPEHLLIGLIRAGDGAVERILAPAGVSRGAVRAEIERSGAAGEQVPTSVEVPFTGAAQAVLRAAVGEADRMGHEHIAPPHMLLGLLDVEDSLAAAILSRYGLHAAGVREQIRNSPEADTPAEPADAFDAAPSVERAVDLYRQLLEAWNRRNPEAFAALFADTGSAVGFDGSQMNGRGEIASTLREVFASHPTASYVAKVREVRPLGGGAALLRAVVGMVPPGKREIKPDVNAVQSVVFVAEGRHLAIALLQNTPAAFHGRPDLAQQLTEELSALVRAGRIVDGP